jgi:hypothetical protein
MNKYLPALWLFFILTYKCYSQENTVNKGFNDISEQAVKAQLDFLASDWTEGRETGEKGIDLAADYIASMFQVYGLKPGINKRRQFGKADAYESRPLDKDSLSYFQEFPLVKYEDTEDHSLSVITETGRDRKIINFRYKTDFAYQQKPLTGQEGEFPVVFAGYGIINKEQNYDDYKGINVKGKVVLRLIGYPGHRDTTSEAWRKFHPQGNIWTKYRDELDRNDIAMEKGAVAVITVYTVQDISLHFAENIFRYNYDDYEGDVPRQNLSNKRYSFPDDTVSETIPAFNVTLRLARELISGTGIDFDVFEKKVQETMKPSSKELKDKRIYFRTTVKTSIIKARNIVGTIEGQNPEEILVVGAHYDHLGKYNGFIYNGADDNASGTVAVMEIARACMATGTKPKRTILFAAWTAEEEGLLGSEYFVNHPPSGKIIFYMNFDMISRDDKNDSTGRKCSMVYSKAYNIFEAITGKHNETYSLGLKIEYKPKDKPLGGSDHSSFARRQVPVSYFMAGWHDDYHKPTDHSNKVNIDKMTDIIRLGFLNVWYFANEGITQ